MTTKQVIAQLSENFAPTRPLYSTSKRLLLVGVCVVVWLAGGIGIFKLRSDIAAILNSPQFLVPTILLLALALFGAWTTLRSVSPGEGTNRLERLVVGLSVALLAWLVPTAIIAVARGNLYAHGVVGGSTCLLAVLTLGAAPGILLLYLVNRGAALRSSRSSGLALLTAGSSGALGLQFICPNGHGIHILLWHFLPLVALALSGMLLGQTIFSWERKVSAISKCAE